MPLMHFHHSSPRALQSSKDSAIRSKRYVQTIVRSFEDLVVATSPLAVLADAGSSPAVQSKTYLERSRPMLPSRPKRMYVTRVLCCWSSHLFVDRTRWKQKQYKCVRRKPDSRVYLAVDNPKRGPGRYTARALPCRNCCRACSVQCDPTQRSICSTQRSTGIRARSRLRLCRVSSASSALTNATPASRIWLGCRVSGQHKALPGQQRARRLIAPSVATTRFTWPFEIVTSQSRTRSASSVLHS